MWGINLGKKMRKPSKRLETPSFQHENLSRGEDRISNDLENITAF